MARIRTVKPEYWTSEQVTNCSIAARLAFIGLLNFCDDAGRHPASPKRLKMQVFPADDISSEQVKELVLELIENGLVMPYQAAGKWYWQVTGWHHQKIDKPTIRHPEPAFDVAEFDDPSSIIRRYIADSSPPEGKGREGIGVLSRGNFTPKVTTGSRGAA